MVLIEFNEEGHILLDPRMGNFGCEVKAGKWHSLISLETDSVAYEVKEGPVSPIEDSNFAPEAPSDNSIAISAYKQALLKELGIIE